MKNIFLFIVLGMLMTACEDMLKEESKTEIDQNTFFSDAADAETVLLGVYLDFSENDTYGLNLSLFLPTGNDLEQCGLNSIANFRALPTNTHTPAEAYVVNTWRAIYTAVYDASNFIESLTKRMDDFTASDKELAKIYIGEAKTLRALAYFELVRYWGNIPLLKTTADSEKPNEEYVQAKPEEVYTFIEQDLKEAAEVLPWSTGEDIRSNSSFRMSRGAALGLLGKVYCQWAGYPLQDKSKWEKAAEVLSEVIGSGHHSLLPNYETFWSNIAKGVWAPQESLIEISFYDVTSTSNYAPTGRIGKANGVTTNVISGVRGSNQALFYVTFSFVQDFYNQHDPRYGLSIADYYYSGESKLPRSSYPIEQYSKQTNMWNNLTTSKFDWVKYLDKSEYFINNYSSCTNWPFMRFADVLLLYAEAVNESEGAPTQAALNAINMVRRRGHGLDVSTADATVDVPSSYGYSEFQQAVRDERKWELCFEGHRKMDLVRWGTYYEVIKDTKTRLVSLLGARGYYSIADYTVKGKHELLPIPQRDLDLLPNLRQNPNWE
ncbi:MAG: RagB/SusD family nutrient uptake outer membrane protein [Mangrovibacterium sp.]